MSMVGVLSILRPLLTPSVGQWSHRASFSGGRVMQRGSKKNEELPNEAVFYHPKHAMYICWHPEVPFPYEMSKPIPLELEAGEPGALNTQGLGLTPVKEIFRKKNERLVLKELMQLTYSAKYKWLGTHGMKKKHVKKALDPLKQKRDRDYL